MQRSIIQTYFYKTVACKMLTFYRIVSSGLFRTKLKLRCDSRFQLAFTACIFVFKEITLIDSNQGNFFENATVCNKRTLKMTVATQLKTTNLMQIIWSSKNTSSETTTLRILFRKVRSEKITQWKTFCLMN